MERLTKTPGWDFAPAWSPDFSQIAFIYNPGWNPDIHVMNLVGSGLRRVTDSQAIVSEPNWVPQVTGFGEQFCFGPPSCAKDKDGDAFVETPTEVFIKKDFMTFVHIWYDNIQDGVD